MNIMSLRFDNCPTAKWAEMVRWCENNLGVRWNKVWDHHYPYFYFGDEKACLLFTLRWA
jgi:hypothetical protein